MRRVCTICSEIAIVLSILIGLTVTAPPVWNTPSSETTQLTVYSTNSTACDVVTILNATSHDGSILSYSVQSITDAPVFSVGESNSEKVLTCNIETIRAGAATEYNVVVRVTQGNSESAILTLLITVITAPSFDNLKTAKTVSIVENSAAGTTVFELSVTDKDGTGTVTVTIASQIPTEMFTLVGNIVQLKSGVTLNAEAEDTYKLQFTATDGMNAEQTSAVLTVTVTDLNEFPPVFSIVPVYISETLSAGSSVYTVAATDADVGNANNEFTFSMTGSSDFSIGTNSGIISVAANVQLKYTPGTSVTMLTVTAADSIDNSAFTSTATVTVYIKTAPIFTDPINDAILAATEADTLTGAVIKVLTARDNDGDALVYTVVSQNPSTNPMLFVTNVDRLLPTQVILVDAGSTTKSYTLVLSASDTREYTDDAAISVTVNIAQSNIPPVFQSASYEADVLETTAAGTVVFSVTAIDVDAAVNSQLTYSMTGTTHFVINPSNGEIKVAGGTELDYTIKGLYIITVTATDGGSLAKLGTATLRFRITTAPMFNVLNTTQITFINENSAAESIVYQLTVNDEDQIGTVAVSIVSQSPTEMFKLVGTTLKTKNNGLDAETKPNYQLKFKVTDGDNEVESAVLTVILIDKNDNPPVIGAAAPVLISEDHSVGSNAEVMGITAEDADVSSLNNVLFYTIQSGNNENYFVIDAATGSITLSSSPSSMTINQYILKVNVADSGTPVRTATVDVTINIDATPVNECFPNPCNNGASCLSFVNAYSCNCASGWTGSECETDVNDCTSSSLCQNDGACVDGFNTYMCNCAAGWQGTSCTVACTSNTFGANCASTCSCNASRLASDAGTQHCDIVSGACKCNTQWTGAACGGDANECLSASLCTAVGNQVCENTIGSYYCTCKTGYRVKEIDGTCEQDTSTVTAVLQPGEASVAVTLTVNMECPNLDRPSVYTEVEIKLLAMVTEKATSSTRVIITTISCSSITFTSLIVIPDTDTARAALAKELQAIRNGQALDYGGQSVVATSITVAGNTLTASSVSTSEQVCQVYTSISKCPTSYECTYVDGSPSCTLSDNDNNTDLILGLGLGLTMPLIFILMVCAAVWYYIKQSNERRRFLHPDDRDRPWQDRFPSDDSPRHDKYYDNYASRNDAIPDKRDFYGLPPVEFERNSY